MFRVPGVGGGLVVKALMGGELLQFSNVLFQYFYNLYVFQNWLNISPDGFQCCSCREYMNL